MQLATELMQVAYQLVPEFRRQDFEQLFDTAVARFSVGDQYKIKNELIRICEPCEKVIDLRKAVSGKCRKFVHKGRVHYLDELAIETFKEGLELFGQYTLGLWEEVNNTENNFKVLQRQAELERLNAQKFEQQRKAEKLQHILATKLSYSTDHYPVHLIRFGDYFNRCEERMNYSVSARLLTADGSKIEAVTKDLSLNGLYLRVGLKESVDIGDVVEVSLSGQTLDYQQKIGQGIAYEVKRVEYVDGVCWLGLIRSSGESTQEDDWYGEYLDDLICSNKIVYKVNLDNAIDAALKQGHEQVFFARSVTASLFVQRLGNQYQLKYALTCGRSDDLLRFFSDVGQRNYLLELFNRQMLQTLIDDDKEEVLLFCFNHKTAEQLLYFAAFDFQLAQDPALARLFCGYGAKKDSWRVYKVQRVKLTHNEKLSAFRVPGRDGEEAVENRADEPSDLNKLSDALLVIRVDDHQSRQAYRDWSFDSELMTKITQFQLRWVDSGGFEWLNYGLEELRHEPRFAYKTKVVAQLSEGVTLTCTSSDFSARGIQLVLPQPMAVQYKQILLLSFPLLQKITRQLSLSNLQYQLVGSDPGKTILYLQALEVEEQVHHGVKFFRDLIKRNKEKLTLVSESAKRAKLMQALKRLYQQNMVSFPFYVNRIEGHLRMTKLVAGNSPHPLVQLLQDDGACAQVNFAGLFENNSFADFIDQGAGLHTGIDARLDEDNTRSIDIYLGLCVEDEAHVTIETVKTNAQLTTKQALSEFITHWHSCGRFMAFRVYLGPVERVEVRKIATELAYIHHYAQHKSKRIAQLLTRIYYVGEWVDICGYLLHYLDLQTADLVEDKKQKQQLDVIELDF